MRACLIVQKVIAAIAAVEIAEAAVQFMLFHRATSSAASHLAMVASFRSETGLTDRYLTCSGTKFSSQRSRS